MYLVHTWLLGMHLVINFYSPVKSETWDTTYTDSQVKTRENQVQMGCQQTFAIVHVHNFVLHKYLDARVPVAFTCSVE